MGHTTASWRRVFYVIGLLVTLSLVSCDRSKQSAASGKGRKVASLSPAATDMIIGLGAKDHLVAVSNYESSAEVKGLPRVGDYQTTDWETLARLRPDVMIIQIAPDRVPPGLKKHAEELKIELVNVKIDGLEDVLNEMQRLGAVAGELDKGRESVRKLREKLDKLRQECADKPPISTLLVRDENGQDVIGPNNFLDDLLKVVNATNAAASLGKAYPTIDREKLLSLAPEAVIVLLPDARPENIATCRRFWASLPQIPAVKNNRVRIMTEGYALVPGPRVAELARKMADYLRPPATTAPATAPGINKDMHP
jgi:iron complex transport system substrate-binding protein